MEAQEIKLVIFDCDGVLMDSEIVAAEAELEIYREYGIEMEIVEFCARFAGLDSIKVKEAMEGELGRELPDKVRTDVVANVNRKCAVEAKIVDGASEVLDGFDQARCICSNSPPERLEAMLKRVDLHDRFRPYVYSAQAVDPPIYKPKPDLILNALAEFEVEPSEALVVEDSVPGVMAARAAETRVIGFTGASHTYDAHADHLIEAGAETAIRHFRDLPPLIAAMGMWTAEF